MVDRSLSMISNIDKSGSPCYRTGAVSTSGSFGCRENSNAISVYDLSSRPCSARHDSINTMETPMRILYPFGLASILLVSACASSPQHGVVGHESGVTAQESEKTRPNADIHEYLCESGNTITAAYPSANSTTVKYKGASYNMRLAVSGSGSRYIGGGLEWWTKGSTPGPEGTLFQHMSDGTSGEILEKCSRS